MTQPAAEARQSSGDEGAAQTEGIVAAMKARRVDLKWSAKRFADEMAAAGVPWNRDVVVNLERGRRKSLRVHEVITAAYVLGVRSPLELLVPARAPFYPVTPRTEVATGDVLSWFRGGTGPLRDYLAADVDEQERILQENGLSQLGPRLRQLVIELTGASQGRL